MSDNPEDKPRLGTVGNIGKPILLTDVNMHGVSSKAAQCGEQVDIWVRLAMTSDDRNFHRIVHGLCGVIHHHAQSAGSSVNLDRASTIVLIIRHDDRAELWVDTAAVSVNIMVKRSMAAGSVVFENDIADVTDMWFPALTIEKTDRIVVLFRKDWAFGLYFDFNPDQELDTETARRNLGRLYRILKYRHLYDTMADATVVEKLTKAGWFPFVEILGSEFRNLANSCEADFPLEDVESTLVASFNNERLDRMVARWASKPHFQGKLPLLQAAVQHFKAKEPIATIKIALTEIEGVLRAAYPITAKPRPRIADLLEYAIDTATQKAGGVDTLLLPEAFAQYLNGYTFAHFNPAVSQGTAGSRHAVGHGAAETDSYTQVRALQVLLTLDQLAFCT
tara:strand:+ start:3700 stop:4875 length:1176 start_codon:yes stop_codon:yes gene_type:complete